MRVEQEKLVGLIEESIRELRRTPYMDATSFAILERAGVQVQVVVTREMRL